MKIVYKAEDGRVFDSEVECCQYERVINVAKDSTFRAAVKSALWSLVESPILRNEWNDNGPDTDTDCIVVDSDTAWDKLSKVIALNFQDIANAFDNALVDVPAKTKKGKTQ